MNQYNLAAKGDVFFSAGLSVSRVAFWNKVQDDYLKRKFFFIEYGFKNNSENLWRCFLQDKSSIDHRLDNKSLLWDGDKFNESLKNELLDQESYTHSFWDHFMNDITWSGYFIPVDDFAYFTQPQMEDEIRHAYLLSKYFKSKDYFLNIKRDSIEQKWKNDPIAILGMWHYLIFYANFLYTCFEDETISENPNTNWHSRNLSFKEFYSYLPSKQISSLLLLVIELGYDPNLSSSKFYRFIKYTHPSVKLFFDTHSDAISMWINNQSGALFSEEMKADFIDCCQADKKIICALEILENSHKLNFQSQLPNFATQKIKENAKKSFITKIREALPKKSILNLLWYETFNTTAKPKSYFPRPTQPTISSKIKWYDLSAELIDAIYEGTKQFPNPINSSFEEIVHQRWSYYMLDVANAYAPPIVLWKMINGKTIPLWNIFDNHATVKHKSAFYRKQESIAEQKKRLKQYVFNLKKIHTLPEIENYTSELVGFLDPLLSLKWEQEIEKHKLTTQGIVEYRNRRMQELGITDSDEKDPLKTEIWLNEMLQIEDEIKSYIPFVKKAFNAALPVRKTVEFNSERHDVSGIEFDPATINDQNKWLRGEVMKTMKTKTKLGEIEQINAFCLDFSGSMRHARMRNLFKVLYLLILGLEDRRSYDAFHFFNSAFIEGSNFTEEFTKRSLLFNILSKISIIEKDKVLYSGYLGTNIGEGVLECHNRIHAFKEKIKQKKPNSDFACSMFVITDGEPSIGIIDLDELNDFIQEKREDGEIAIKGIYIKDKEDDNNFMESIFGEDEFVETTEFGEAVNNFVSIMTKTYKEQRVSYRWKMKKESINGGD